MGYNQRLGTHLACGEVRFSLRVLKQAEFGALLGQRGGLGLTVALPDPHQDEHPALDGGECLSLDRNAGVADTLQDDTHEGFAA